MSAAVNFIRFSRPHTIIGTTLSVSALYVMALLQDSLSSSHLASLLWALLSCWGANIYIVGLNQLTDVEIDRINKPELPLASGAYSQKQGWIIVLSSFSLSLGLAVWQGGYLLTTVILSLLIGTAYSLPPLRLKRFHFWAAASIFTVRGLIVNIFIFLHFQAVSGRVIHFPPRMIALTGFIFLLSLVIAWFKDIPDEQGDRRFRIVTLTVQLGKQVVFRSGMAILTAAYLGVILAAVLGLPGTDPVIMIGAHLLLLFAAWYIAGKVDLSAKTSVRRFYLFIWLLFFLEYLIFPVASLAPSILP